MNEPERPQGEWGRRDSNERDRTLARVRTTTAVTGVGAVLVGGALAGWLGHEANQSSPTKPSSSSSSDRGSASDSDDGPESDDGPQSDDGLEPDDGLSGPASVPAPGSGSQGGQPGITSGGS
jgi:hypothetical protein